jgi:HAMP domain-containing protein
MLGILLLSTLITFFSSGVSRARLPICRSGARVAEGDLSVRVEDAEPFDEIGQLACAV